MTDRKANDVTVHNLCLQVPGYHDSIICLQCYTFSLDCTCQGDFMSLKWSYSCSSRAARTPLLSMVRSKTHKKMENDVMK